MHLHSPKPYYAQTLVKRLQDYELPFIRGTTVDHTGQKLHVQVPFSVSFGNWYFTPRKIHIYANKL